MSLLVFSEQYSDGWFMMSWKFFLISMFLLESLKLFNLIKYQWTHICNRISYYTLFIFLYTYLNMVLITLYLIYCVGFAYCNMGIYKHSLESLIKAFDESCQRKTDVLIFDFDSKGTENVIKFKSNSHR